MRLIPRFITAIVLVIVGICTLSITIAMSSGALRSAPVVAYMGQCSDQASTCLLDITTGIYVPYSAQPDLRAVWSADMDMVAAYRTGDIHVETLTGSIIQEITSRHAVVPRAWADDQTLIYEEYVSNPNVRGGFSFFMWQTNVHTGEATELTPLHLPSMFEYDMSPDGTRMVYYHSGLWYYNMTTQAYRSLGYAGAPRVSWSPDSAQFAVAPGGNVLRIVDGTSGDTVHEVDLDLDAPPPARRNTKVFDYLLWSSDGASIYFHHTLDKRLYRYTVADGQAAPISPHTFDLTGSVYELPTGNHLLLIENERIRTVNLLTARTRTIATLEANRFIGNWQW